MYSTDELIEKYKAEMQKMISNSKPLESKPSPEPQTEHTSQPQKHDTIEQFPKFTADSEMLNQRIEEILRENSDVAIESDRPDNLLKTLPMQNTEQGDLVLDGDELVSELEADEISKAPKRVIRPPVFVSENSPLRPINSDTQAPIIQPRLPGEQNDFQASEETENIQEMVSRTCIRGGQKAQYSPPANTGLALGVNTQPTPPLTDTGTLRIETFTANRAIPIGDAVIRVKNEESNRLVAVFVTDSSGNTQSFTLPTPDRALSETPDAVHPFVNYLVDINAEGFVPQNNLPVQMFGGTQSYLPANLIPLNT